LLSNFNLFLSDLIYVNTDNTPKVYR